jgi:predicted naringenin-chalcone synthase
MSYITAIGTAVPDLRFDQSTICAFMELMMAKQDPLARRKIRAVFRASGIDSRHSVLEDYGRTGNFSFYPNDNGEPFPSTKDRMRKFCQFALPLSVAAVRDMVGSSSGLAIADVTHLIVVSCTGMYAPGLDIDLVKELGLARNVQRICIQFMGCYAAFNALKVARAICESAASQKVLIVCTELCSLHFQQLPSDDNILANALFGDGSACMLVESEKGATKSLQIHSFHSDLALNGAEDMAWNIGDLGFQMRLSSYVPELIKGQIANLIRSLLDKIMVKRNDIRFFAMHPGGVKILKTIEEQLGLSKLDNESAYTVLRKFGNLSSATVVFVLKEIFQKLSENDHDNYVLSMGFGPGLTLESMLLKIKTLRNA